MRDVNRSQTTPHITRIFLIASITFFFANFFLEFSDSRWLQGLLGLTRETPLWLVHASQRYGLIPEDILMLRGERMYTLFSSMFLHADLWHLGGNMLYLYIFGDNVEDTLGHARYALFYIVAGLVASMVHITAVVYSVEVLHSAPRDVLYYIPAFGASGAIAGVLGAYAMLYPRARILTLVLVGWMYIVPIPAVFLLGFWFVYQLLYGMLALGLPIGVAYWAHIGGFVAGILFGLVWRGRRRTRVT